MQKRLHNFMDKMQQKPLEERRKLLLTSTIFLGAVITVFGLWNISSDLLAMNTEANNKVAVESEGKVATPSLFSSLESSIASVWSTVRGNLQELNDKLGTSNGQ